MNEKLKTGKTQVQIVVIPVRRDHLLQGIAEGRGDIAASDIAITTHRKKTVTFSDPVRADAKQIVVTGPSAPALSSVADLSGKEVYVRRSSHYWETLSHLNDRLGQAGKPEIILKAADEHLEDEDRRAVSFSFASSRQFRHVPTETDPPGVKADATLLAERLESD